MNEENTIVVRYLPIEWNDDDIKAVLDEILGLKPPQIVEIEFWKSKPAPGGKETSRSINLHLADQGTVAHIMGNYKNKNVNAVANGVKGCFRIYPYKQKVVSESQEYVKYLALFFGQGDKETLLSFAKGEFGTLLPNVSGNHITINFNKETTEQDLDILGKTFTVVLTGKFTSDSFQVFAVQAEEFPITSKAPLHVTISTSQGEIPNHVNHVLASLVESPFNTPVPPKVLARYGAFVVNRKGETRVVYDRSDSVFSEKPPQGPLMYSQNKEVYLSPNVMNNKLQPMPQGGHATPPHPQHSHMGAHIPMHQMHPQQHMYPGHAPHGYHFQHMHSQHYGKPPSPQHGYGPRGYPQQGPPQQGGAQRGPGYVQYTPVFLIPSGGMQQHQAMGHQGPHHAPPHHGLPHQGQYGPPHGHAHSGQH